MTFCKIRQATFNSNSCELTIYRRDVSDKIKEVCEYKKIPNKTYIIPLLKPNKYYILVQKNTSIETVCDARTKIYITGAGIMEIKENCRVIGKEFFIESEKSVFHKTQMKIDIQQKNESQTKEEESECEDSEEEYDFINNMTALKQDIDEQIMNHESTENEKLMNHNLKRRTTIIVVVIIIAIGILYALQKKFRIFDHMQNCILYLCVRLAD